MRRAIVILLLLAAANSFAESHCYQNHLAQALKINRERLDLYGALSNGESIAVSKRLIALEELALFAKNYLFIFDYDRMSEPWLKGNIDITCESFVSMKSTPPFTGVFKDGYKPQAKSFINIDGHALKNELKKALKQSPQNLLETTNDQLQILSAEPHLNCMVRHILSSIARIATLEPSFLARAKAKNLKSTGPVIKKLLENHIRSMPDFVKLDEMAAPLNEKGLAILCGDLPNIPPNY